MPSTPDWLNLIASLLLLRDLFLCQPWKGAIVPVRNQCPSIHLLQHLHWIMSSRSGLWSYAKQFHHFLHISISTTSLIPIKIFISTQKYNYRWWTQLSKNRPNTMIWLTIIIPYVGGASNPAPECGIFLHIAKY